MAPLKDLDPKLLARLPKDLSDMANAIPLPDFEHALPKDATKLPTLPTAFPSSLPTALPTGFSLPSSLPFPAPRPTASGTGGKASTAPKHSQ